MKKNIFAKSETEYPYSIVLQPYKFDLSIAVTSVQQPLFCRPMGGCCREVALYSEFGN